MAAYEIQGRRTTRGADGKRHDEVRLESAATSTQAFDIAEAMVADRLTAWVFETQQDVRGKKYRLLGVKPGAR